MYMGRPQRPFQLGGRRREVAVRGDSNVNGKSAY